MFVWSQLDFSAIPVSISAVSLTSRQTWQNVNSKRRLQRIQNVQEGKRHKKKSSTSFCLCSFCFWGEVSSSWILNDIDRNFLLENRKENSQMFNEDFYLPLYLHLWWQVHEADWAWAGERGELRPQGRRYCRHWEGDEGASWCRPAAHHRHQRSQLHQVTHSRWRFRPVRYRVPIVFMRIWMNIICLSGSYKNGPDPKGSKKVLWLRITLMRIRMRILFFVRVRIRPNWWFNRFFRKFWNLAKY